MRLAFLAVATTVVLLGIFDVAQAQNCCIPQLGDDPHAARLVAGIQSATLLLIAVPFLLVASISLWMRARLRADGAEISESALESAAGWPAPSETQTISVQKTVHGSR